MPDHAHICLPTDPLITLSRWLQHGALAYDPAAGEYVLRDEAGSPIAGAPLLYKLCAELAAREGDLALKRRQIVMLCVKRRFMPGVRSVLNVGESISGFVLEAIRHEVARRRAEDAAELVLP